MIKIHNSKCPNSNSTVQLSNNGVSECLSNQNSLDVYSLRFNNCRNIYPTQIIRPIGKHRVDQRKYLEDFLADVCINHCHIHSFIGDNAKRSIGRGSKSHAGYYPCEYCESRGILLHNQDASFQARKLDLQRQKQVVLKKLDYANAANDEDEINTLTSLLKSVNESIKSMNRKNNNIVWPSSTRNGTPRTIERILQIVYKIANDDILSLDEAKGIMARSLFLDIPYFHFVLDIPAEYLHSVCLGVVKRCIVLTFNVGESRQRNTNR